MMRKSGKGKAILLSVLLSFALLLFACSDKAPTASITLTDDSFTLGSDGAYTITVASDIDTLDVLNYFEVSDGFTLKLYSDAACTTEVEGDPTLAYGENVFYLRAEPTGKGTGKTVTVKITREQGYAIVFMDGTTEVGRLYVDAGTLIGEGQVPTPAPKAGYTFGGWDGLDLSVAPTASATYQAIWTANTDTPYKVEHYLQNAARDGYELHETENLTGETDTTATATPKLTGDYATYTHNPEAAGSLLSGSIAGDGSLVLKVYYDKALAYTIVFMDGETEVGRVTVEVGEKVAEEDIPTPAPKAGYTFGGWDGFDADVAPTGNATYQAVWTPNPDTAYKVEHYLQKTDLSGYELHETEEGLTGETDSTATATPKTGGDYEGYVHNADADGSLLSAPIAGDGSLVLKVYYDHITYEITFDFDYTTDIDADGVRYEGITGGTAVVLYGGQITFTVYVNEDYNQSNVQYKFTPAGGSVVDLEGQFNSENKSYTFTYAPTESGTVSMEGTYQENAYQAEVNLNLTLFDPKWGTLSSLDEVQIIIDGGDPIAYTEAVENKITTTLKYGDHTVTIKDGERTTDFTLSVKPADWDAKLSISTVYSVDVTMTVGYSRVEVEKENIDQNLDGTLGKVTTGNNAIRILDGDTSGDFAVNMRYTITNMAVDWSALDFRIGTLQIQLSDVDVLVNANGTKVGSDASTGKTRFQTALSTALLLRTANNAAIAEKPFIVDYTIVRLYDDQLRMYFGVVNNDNPEEETWYYVGNLTKTALNIVGATSVAVPAAAATVINGILTSTVPALNYTQNNNFTLTYSHYGVSTSFFYNEVILPESAENGTVTGTSGRVKVGETVTVTATPNAEMAVTSFTVKKNGGEAVAVESAGYGTVSGEPDVARVFTYTPDCMQDTYEFAATFALSEYVTVTFEATYPEWYHETGDILTVATDSETPAVATAQVDGTYEVKLKRGSYSTVTVSSARFRVSKDIENKAFSSVEVTGGLNLTGGTAIAFTLPKIGTPEKGSADAYNGFSYNDSGYSFTAGSGGPKLRYMYPLAGVTASEGFVFSYTVSATGSGWYGGGFCYKMGNTWFSIVPFLSNNTPSTGVRLGLAAHAAGTQMAWQYSALRTSQTVNATFKVKIVYYDGGYYIGINDHYAGYLGRAFFEVTSDTNCPIALPSANRDKVINTDMGGQANINAFFSAGERTFGIRSGDNAESFTNVQYALGNEAAKAAAESLYVIAKADTNKPICEHTPWPDWLSTAQASLKPLEAILPGKQF